MSNSNIHPTAIIEEGAEIHESVIIGPYCRVGGHVKIAKDNELQSHVIIEGHTSIDEGNKFFPFATIGFPPQDHAYKGEPTQTIIGKNNIFREYVSVHRATMKQDQKTIIGSNSLFMAYVHFGHDTIIGDKCVIANGCQFAGHVEIGDEVSIGGGAMFSQFIKVGRKSFIAGQSAVDRDLPPFSTVMGNRAKVKGINIIGLKRSKFERNHISQLVSFFGEAAEKGISGKALWSECDKSIYSGNILMDEFISFLEGSKKGVATFSKEK